MVVPQQMSGAGRVRPKRGALSVSFTIFPLLVFPVLVYAVLAVTAGASSDPGLPGILGSLNEPFFAIPMASDVRWRLTVGDCLLLFSLLMLSIEIVKSTSSKSGAIINHVASMILLLVCIILFLLVGNFATSVFFLITMMTLLDVLAGVMVTIVSARRDFGVGDGFG